MSLPTPTAVPAPFFTTVSGEDGADSSNARGEEAQGGKRHNKPTSPVPGNFFGGPEAIPQLDPSKTIRIAPPPVTTSMPALVPANAPASPAWFGEDSNNSNDIFCSIGMSQAQSSDSGSHGFRQIFKGTAPIAPPVVTPATHPAGAQFFVNNVTPQAQINRQPGSTLEPPPPPNKRFSQSSAQALSDFIVEGEEANFIGDEVFDRLSSISGSLSTVGETMHFGNGCGAECPRCRKVNDSHAVFCCRCGYQLRENDYLPPLRPIDTSFEFNPPAPLTAPLNATLHHANDTVQPNPHHDPVITNPHQVAPNPYAGPSDHSVPMGSPAMPNQEAPSQIQKAGQNSYWDAPGGSPNKAYQHQNVGPMSPPTISNVEEKAFIDQTSHYPASSSTFLPTAELTPATGMQASHIQTQASFSQATHSAGFPPRNDPTQLPGFPEFSRLNQAASFGVFPSASSVVEHASSVYHPKFDAMSMGASDHYQIQPLSHGKKSISSAPLVSHAFPPPAPTKPAVPFSTLVSQPISSTQFAVEGSAAGSTSEAPSVETFKQRTHPVVCFGFGGQLCVSFPMKQMRFSMPAAASAVPAQKAQQYRPGPMHRINPTMIPSVKQNIVDPATIICDGLPLCEKSTKTKDLIHALETQLSQLSSSSSASKMALLRLLLLMVTHRGGIASAEPDALHRVLAVDQSPGYDASRRPSLVASPVSPAASMPPTNSNVELSRLLANGDRSNAVLYAVTHQMWAHALLIASHVDRDTYCAVVSEFARRTLPVGHPLRALYLLFGGQSALVGAEQMQLGPEVKGTWAKTLLTILMNRTADDHFAVTGLGDALLKNDDVLAAHVCFLLSDDASLISGADTGTGRIVYLGRDHQKYPYSFGRDWEGFRLTEILEFALRQASNGRYLMAHLQAYKLLYAQWLADLGLDRLALKYCETLNELLHTNQSAYIHQDLLEQLRAFHARLAQHMGVSVAKAESESRWLPKMGGILDAFDRGLTKVMGVTNQETSEVGGEETLSGGIRRLSIQADPALLIPPGSTQQIPDLTPGRASLKEPASETTSATAVPMFNPVTSSQSSTTAMPLPPVPGQQAPISAATSDQGHPTEIPPSQPHQEHMMAPHQPHQSHASSPQSHQNYMPPPPPSHHQGYVSPPQYQQGYYHPQDLGQPLHPVMISSEGTSQSALQDEGMLIQQTSSLAVPAPPALTFSPPKVFDQPVQNAWQVPIGHQIPTLQSHAPSSGDVTGSHFNAPPTLQPYSALTIQGRNVTHTSLPQSFAGQTPSYAPSSQPLMTQSPPHIDRGSQGASSPQMPPSVKNQGERMMQRQQPPGPAALPSLPPPMMHSGPSMAVGVTPPPPKHASQPHGEGAPMLFASTPDGEEDFGFGNVSKQENRHPASSTVASASEGQNGSNESNEIKQEGDKKSGVFGFITGFFGGRKSNSAESTGPKQANLGEPSSFHYDEKLKRWVDTKDPQSAQTAAAPPPPPSVQVSAAASTPLPAGAIPDASPANYRRGMTRSARSRYVDPFNPPNPSEFAAEDPTLGAPVVPIVPVAGAASQAPSVMMPPPQPEPTVYHAQAAPLASGHPASLPTQALAHPGGIPAQAHSHPASLPAQTPDHPGTLPNPSQPPSNYSQAPPQTYHSHHQYQQPQQQQPANNYQPPPTQGYSQQYYPPQRPPNPSYTWPVSQPAP